MIHFSPEKVVEIRREKGMSREALAAAAGVPYGTLTALELGYNAPSVENVARVVSALRVSIADVFVEKDEPATVSA